MHTLIVSTTPLLTAHTPMIRRHYAINLILGHSISTLADTLHIACSLDHHSRLTFTCTAIRRASIQLSTVLLHPNTLILPCSVCPVPGLVLLRYEPVVLTLLPRTTLTESRTTTRGICGSLVCARR